MPRGRGIIFKLLELPGKETDRTPKESSKNLNVSEGYLMNGVF